MQDRYPISLDANDGPVERNETQGFDIIRESELRDLAAYWRRLRGGTGLPKRTDIDPIEIPWALDRLYIAIAEPPPVHWRYVLAGQEIVGAFKRNTLRGVGLNEILSPTGFAGVVERWAPVADGDAVYMAGRIYRSAERFIQGARLLLPLGDKTGTVAGLLGMTITARVPPDAPSEGPDAFRVWRIAL